MKNIIKIIILSYQVVMALLLYRKNKEYTRISKNDFVVNILLTYQYRKVEGIIVECGVWRGGMLAGMASVCGSDREYHLFDSFEGLPKAKNIDGERALEWQETNRIDNCITEEHYAQMAMKKAGCNNVHIHKGWFEDTLGEISAESKIAILRLDADWYESTMQCFDALYDKVSEDGVVIIDDYYAWDGCSRAVHDFLANRKSTARLRQFMNRVAYLKRA